MRPELFAALGGAELILHAGDVGDGVLSQLRAIGPVQAVYGNTDPPGQPGLVARLDLEINGHTIHVSHGHEVGSPTAEKLLARYTADVIVFGHTHKPLIEWSGKRLVVNPGAAGPRRFKLQPSVALMTVTDAHVEVEIRWL